MQCEEYRQPEQTVSSLLVLHIPCQVKWTIYAMVVSKSGRNHRNPIILLQNYRLWKMHLFVQVKSFIMTSAIVYAVVSLCAINPHFMDPDLLVGMIFTSCVPTTVSSNVVVAGQAQGNHRGAVNTRELPGPLCDFTVNRYVSYQPCLVH